MQVSMRATSLRLPAAGRKAVIVKSSETDSKPVSSSPAPEWLPKEAKPALDFFNAEDVQLNTVLAPVTGSSVYEKYVKDYAESQTAKESFGWKRIPESINGRAAMIGFLAGAGGEVFGAGSLLQQLAAAPQWFVATLVLVSAGSVIPYFMGNKGDYIKSLQDIYALPEGWFTESNEKIHGRIAMIGLTSLLAIELFKGSALL